MATNLLITSSRMQVPAVQNAVLSEKFILNIETEQSGSVAKVTGRHFDSGIQLRQHVQLTFLCLEVMPSQILYPGHSMLTYYRIGQPKLFKEMKHRPPIGEIPHEESISSQNMDIALRQDTQNVSNRNRISITETGSRSFNRPRPLDGD